MHSKDENTNREQNTINLLFSFEASFNGEAEYTIEITMQLTNTYLAYMKIYSLGVVTLNIEIYYLYTKIHATQKEGVHRETTKNICQTNYSLTQNLKQ